jgi:hypothetical protein
MQYVKKRFKLEVDMGKRDIETSKESIGQDGTGWQGPGLITRGLGWTGPLELGMVLSLVLKLALRCH